jgi:hypothetical protein
MRVSPARIRDMQIAIRNDERTLWRSVVDVFSATFLKKLMRRIALNVRLLGGAGGGSQRGAESR